MLPSKIFLRVIILGSMSGFTLMIAGNSLNFWLAKKNVDIRTIGVFALISIPYAINFIWSPFLDTIRIPYLYRLLGQRLSWLVCVQSTLSFIVYLMSKVNITNQIELIALLGLIVSFLASAQDSILGALRTELVPPNRQGDISGFYILGYRIGMLISGSLAIYISQYLSWNKIYKLFALTIIIFPILLVLFFRKVNLTNQDNRKKSRLNNLISDIIKPIGTNWYIGIILIFLILYRLPDNFISMMINPFFIHIGYNEFEIATGGKFFGSSCSIIGSLLASWIMRKYDIYRSLLLFGLVHALAHMLFITQELQGKNLYLFFLIVGVESISGGMTMSSYIAFIASLCKGKYRATQYSFFSSMMGLSRSILPALSGYIVAHFGWITFYSFTTLATIPSLMMINYLKRNRIKS